MTDCNARVDGVAPMRLLSINARDQAILWALAHEDSLTHTEVTDRFFGGNALPRNNAYDRMRDLAWYGFVSRYRPLSAHSPMGPEITYDVTDLGERQLFVLERLRRA